MSIPVTASGVQISGPSYHPLIRTATYSTNATSSTNWGRHGYTLDLFLGKAGHGFENVLGSTLHRMGFGPNAALIRFERVYMELREDWDWLKWSKEEGGKYKAFRGAYRRLIRYVRGYCISIVVIRVQSHGAVCEI